MARTRTKTKPPRRLSGEEASRRLSGEGLRVVFDEREEPMTGLIVPSGLPWDTPNTWTIEALVTFESQLRRRTDQVEMRVIADPGDSRFAVRQKAAAVFRRICAVEATIVRMRPPLDAETIAFLQEFNAQLQKDRYAARAAYDREHEEALAMNADLGARAPAEQEEPAATEPQEKQLVFA